MFRINSIVLTAALYGRSVVGASAAGCYPAYSSSSIGDYVAGSKVSATKTVTTTVNATYSTTTTETHNYECVPGPNAAFCKQSSFVPGGQYSDTAWIEEPTACTGAATPATAPAPAAWSGGGCPKAFAAGTAYSAEDLVSVVGPSHTMVYQCKASPVDQFCSQAGYEPGDSIYWEQAWDSLGSCTGTIAPTGSPSYDALPDAGGCPGAFDDGETYEEGDQVSKDGLVYKCQAWPQSAHCSQAGYEPGTSIGSGSDKVEYWKQAWTLTGYCNGTIAPTSSPNYVSLTDMGGCPDEWASQTYDEGDKVAQGGLVYKCKAWPFSGHCGQAGYEPNIDPAAPGAWKDAWTVAGYCSGSMGPTASPSFDAVNSVGACPEEWVAGSNVAYDEGDMVSVTVSETPLRKVAYRCKAWPFSGFCGQFSPTQSGGEQGWTLAGSCDGSIGPTASPSFDTLADTNMGCPGEWSASETGYEAGDLVSYTLSDAPERKVVYECREWPNTGYCNQGAGFDPTSEYGKMAWTQKGYCTGTIAPTAAPAAYSGNCTYTKTVITKESCAPGDAGCSCSAGQPASASCEKDVTSTTTPDVESWSSSVEYVTDDVVRVGTKRFKCREWPNYFWCRIEAYRPTSGDSSIWSQAWTADGDCP